eukprot:CAMPEP_0113714668 /NCGR_PEP_ID=MMETSP0038_2-20120614/32761_1 /TAXON_ID=2898 /ORGANISM="Cryptomonas paramecium" /LENGTH=66 /DNA_ID=CAMNT_0000641703 /DNA_START=52 /DNA_END=248 /DNA_ORIENTATION=+ /assembly_acc=CAM_ASM_000170
MTNEDGTAGLGRAYAGGDTPARVSGWHTPRRPLAGTSPRFLLPTSVRVRAAGRYDSNLGIPRPGQR